MIKDFTPANTTLTSGVVIKQNLLERNRQAPPEMKIATTMSVYYTGSPADPYSTSSTPSTKRFIIIRNSKIFTKRFSTTKLI